MASLSVFSAAERAVFRKLDAPWKIQEFLDRIPSNFEPEGDTCLSPRRVLRENRCHCIEGALLAAVAFRFHGRKPLVVYLRSGGFDVDHVVAVFREGRLWGSISKTNHAVLRYREPVYLSVRELVMSFFHEYFDDRGRKSLRSFSDPVDLSRFDGRGWMTSEESVWYIPEYLNEVRFHRILTRSQIASLRPASPIEIKAGEIVAWRKPAKR